MECWNDVTLQEYVKNAVARPLGRAQRARVSNGYWNIEMNSAKCLFNLFTIILLSGTVVTISAQNPDTTYTVGGVITNYKQDKTIYVAMFSNSNDFKQCKPYKKLRFSQNQLPPDTLLFIFSEVDPGEYIIAAYQDINGDNKMNKGLFGPTEPYRIYKPNYGFFVPKFSKCKFIVNYNITTANLALK